MKRFSLLLALFVLGLPSCYDPQLNDSPFVCGGSHGSPECPDGYSCYGGVCLDEKPACWQDNFFNGSIAGFVDEDLEPNNVPSLAWILECGDVTNAACPVRYDVTRTLSGLAVCGEGDIDIYAIHLTAGEQIDLTMTYYYDPNRDLDLVLFHQDPDTGKYNLSNPDAQGFSSNDNESFIATAGTTGWYYVMVFGKTYNDINAYVLQWKLIAAAQQ
ncbi:MAG: PPC domain-containing protein [Deltaproteobacteria bacterium]|nr:PPC domain-containing protein [Deltaproteobacteria bacterium]